MNHGNTRRHSHTNPASGRSAPSQRAERSTIESVSAVSATNMTIIGPLTRMPAANAVQNAVTNSQLSRGVSGTLFAAARHHTYARASTAMATITVNVSTASVLASRAST